VSEPGRDHQIRLAAFAHLRQLVDVHGEMVPRTALAAGFDYQGERIHLIAPQGIFQPAAIRDAPLSITTAPPSDRKPRPYEDEIGPDDGLLRYRYRGTDPLHRENVGLRRAMAEQIPLIYFFGLEPGLYWPIWPVFIIGDDPANLTFTVSADETSLAAVAPATLGDHVAEGRRRYITAQVQRRLHQQEFRLRVLAAYERRCTICRLRHVELLDAAHILEDRHPKGEPAVWNGLALCKIHHAAFDRFIIGIRPDHQIDIRADILKEVDGPMLLHGIQQFQGASIVVPRRLEQRPNTEFLEERYARFRAAS